MNPNLRNVAVLIAAIVLVIGAWRAWGWGGVALVTGGVFLWVMLHFTRLTQVLRRAADRPMGHVGSAVMLNAKLQKGQSLLHVIALTRSLGELRSVHGEQPEYFRWTDPGGSYVTCEFRGGRLAAWQMVRPQPDGAGVGPGEGPVERPDGRSGAAQGGA